MLKFKKKITNNKYNNMSYKIILEEFDKEITTRIDHLTTKFEDIVFDSNESHTYVVESDFDCKANFPIEKRQGVYLFELNVDNASLEGLKRSTKVKNFAKNWAHKKNDSFFSPSVIKKRLKMRKDFDEQWLPIYIGKSKNVYKRISEHIDLLPTKNTYAMKLKHRINLYGLEFRISIIEVNVKNYDFIVPHIERSLREKYNPLIGKQ